MNCRTTEVSFLLTGGVVGIALQLKAALSLAAIPTGERGSSTTSTSRSAGVGDARLSAIIKGETVKYIYTTKGENELLLLVVRGSR